MTTKLLIVDDEKDLQQIYLQKFRNRIAQKEYEFFFALNGVEALQKLKEEQDIEIVLVDINMPQMDGLTLLNEINQLGRGIMTVIITAYGDLGNLRSAMNRRAFDFLTKPIDFNDLETTIQKLVSELKIIKDTVQGVKKNAIAEHELAAARAIQKALLPVAFHTCAPSEVASTVLTGYEVGNDFYDIYPMDGGQFGFVIGDVAGKGIGGAIYMVIAHILFRSMWSLFDSPQEFMKRANLFLCGEEHKGAFLSAFFGLVDQKIGNLAYCRAGHPPAILLSPNGTIRYLSGPGIVVGVKQDAEFMWTDVSLQNNECVFMYTNGLLEARNESDEEFGEKRLAEALKKYSTLSPRDLINKVIEEIKKHLGEIELVDDLAILAIRFHNMEP